MGSPLSGVAGPARIRPNERPNPADILTQVGALLVVVLAPSAPERSMGGHFHLGVLPGSHF